MPFFALSKYLYYEQFDTEVEAFTIFNAILMIVISAKTLKLALFIEEKSV